MVSPSTSSVYLHVIEDVINKVRQEFLRYGGPDDDILNELQREWEMRMMNAVAIVAPIDRSAANTLQDLNVTYGGSEEYETPTADLLFHLQPPPPNLNPWPHLDVNVADEEAARRAAQARQPMTLDFLDFSSGKRKRDDFPSQHRPGGYIPQQDGAGDVMDDIFEDGQGSDPQLETIVAEFELPPKIPQLDGTAPSPYQYHHDTHSDEVQAPPPSESVNPNDNDEDESLNENDDDDDDLAGVDTDQLDGRNLILTLFDRVTRAKNKWRCSMKNGVMHIGHKDTLFSKALGEFEF